MAAVAAARFPEETENTVSRTTAEGKTIIYRLTIIQQPERARACGSGAKSSADRRPVDPPPVVELRIFESDGPDRPRSDITFSYNANFFLFATLDFARPSAAAAAAAANIANIARGVLPPPQGSQQPGQPPVSPVLTGVPVAGVAYLDRPNQAGYFVFPDLSVRHEGMYRLHFNLYEETKDAKDLDRVPSPPTSAPPAAPLSTLALHYRLVVKSQPFVVYSAKKFPGLSESTDLSRMVAEQGCRVRIRRDVRMRRREAKPKDHHRHHHASGASNPGSARATPDAYPQPPPTPVQRSYAPTPVPAPAPVYPATPATPIPRSRSASNSSAIDGDFHRYPMTATPDYYGTPAYSHQGVALPPLPSLSSRSPDPRPQPPQQQPPAPQQPQPPMHLGFGHIPPYSSAASPPPTQPQCLPPPSQSHPAYSSALPPPPQPATSLQPYHSHTASHGSQTGQSMDRPSLPSLLPPPPPPRPCILDPAPRPYASSDPKQYQYMGHGDEAMSVGMDAYGDVTISSPGPMARARVSLFDGVGVNGNGVGPGVRGVKRSHGDVFGQAEHEQPLFNGGRPSDAGSGVSTSTVDSRGYSLPVPSLAPISSMPVMSMGMSMPSSPAGIGRASFYESGPSMMYKRADGRYVKRDLTQA